MHHFLFLRIWNGPCVVVVEISPEALYSQQALNLLELLHRPRVVSSLN